MTEPVLRTHRIAHRDLPGVALAVDDYAPSEPASTRAEAMPVILLPGFGSVRIGEKALRLARDLPPRGFRFLALDFQGLGDSGGEFRTLTLRRELSDYETVRDALFPRRRHVVVGSSMGGLVASMAAARDPELIVGLVLIAPAFGFRERFEQQLGREVLANWERTNSLLYRGDFVTADLAFDLLRDARTVDELGIASSITQPVLLIHGEADETVPIAESAKAAAAIRAPLEYLPIAGGSHRLDQHLDVLSDSIARFVASIARATTS